MSEEKIYLIEVSAKSADGTTTLTYRFCTAQGYTSLPTDTPPNVFAEPRVIQPGLFRMSMFSPGSTGGASTTGHGEIVLGNADGALDSFLDLGFDGQPLTVKEGYSYTALGNFATVIAGTVEQCEASWDKLIFRFKDPAKECDVPVNLNYYGGTNALPAGIDGVADLKGKAKPRLFGQVSNLTPKCVNTSKLIYQLNDAGLYSIPNVYDMGVALTAGVDRANNAALQSNAPAAGSFDTCLAEGLFRLGSTPTGQVTCDAIQGATAAARTAGQMIKALATERLGAARVATQPIIDLDASAPYPLGIYIPDSMTYAAAFDLICQSVGAWWGFDNSGIFWAKQLTAPDAVQATATLTIDESMTVTRTATADGDRGVPIWKAVVNYAKNWTKQTQLAGSVAQARVAALALEYSTVSNESAALKDVHALAGEVVINSLIVNEADGLTEATRVRTLRGTRRDRLRVGCQAQAIAYPDGGYWDDEAISDMLAPRSRHAAVVHNNWLYVIGGQIEGYNSASVIRLDLSNPTGAWDDAGVTDLPEGRSWHTATVYNGYLYVAGGLTTEYIASVIRLDLSNPTGAWDDAGVTNLPATRAVHTAIVYNGYLYVAGGYTGSYTASVIRLDLSNPTGAWDDAGVTNLPAARGFHAAVLHNNYMYILGGDITGSTASVIRLDLSNPTGAWDDAGVTDLPAARSFHAAIVYGSWLYVLGGSFMYYTESVIRLDLSNPTGAWDDAGVTDFPAARAYLGVVLYSNSIYVLGGYTINAEANTWRLRTNDNPTDLAQRISIGRTMLVKYSRYGYTNGRPMKIIGVESDLAKNAITLDLWG